MYGRSGSSVTINTWKQKHWQCHMTGTGNDRRHRLKQETQAQQGGETSALTDPGTRISSSNGPGSSE